MPTLSRIMTLFAAALLGLMFVTPIWVIRLHAPQYPEGLGMFIRINDVTGVREHDLANINTLNHYIGMKAIEPQAIPELVYMPWIVGALIVAGVVVAAVGRRGLLIGWLATLILTGLAGMYDFWRWGYDYGHNIDAEHAIIVVPDMNYQPPLIGTKQLLNITAASWPHAGAIAAGLAFALAAAALFISYRHTGRATRPAAALGLALAVGCSTGAVPIHFGTDQCEECRMIISDRRFGAEIVTGKGRALKFDSVDCMLVHLKKLDPKDVAGLYVIDATSPGELIPVESAVFAERSVVRPPMGTIAAVAIPDSARRFLHPDARTVSWLELDRTADNGASHAR